MNEHQSTSLSDDVLLEAGHSLYSLFFADAYERSGQEMAPRTEITTWATPAPDEEILPVMADFVSRLAEAWEMDASRVFEALGIEDGHEADFLYYIGMQCQGHGVGPDDFLHDRGYEDTDDLMVEEFGKILDLSPIHAEFWEFEGLANRIVHAELEAAIAEYLEDRDEEDKEYAVGLEVEVESHISTGETLVGKGRVEGYLDGRPIVMLGESTPDWMSGSLYVADLEDVSWEGDYDG